MVKQRKFETAEALFRQQLKLREEGGDTVYSRASTMLALAGVLAVQGRLADAYQLIMGTQALLDKSGETLQPTDRLRRNLDKLQRILTNMQRDIAKNGSDAEPISP